MSKLTVTNKKVNTYLKIKGKDLKNFNTKVIYDGEVYYTDNVVDLTTNCILGITENGLDFDWLNVDRI